MPTGDKIKNITPNAQCKHTNRAFGYAQFTLNVVHDVFTLNAAASAVAPAPPTSLSAIINARKQEGDHEMRVRVRERERERKGEGRRDG
jgi:hypothetical protein